MGSEGGEYATPLRQRRLRAGGESCYSGERSIPREPIPTSTDRPLTEFETATDMSLPTPLGLGIIGCGRVTRTLHLPALAGVPAIRVAALCDLDPRALEAASREHSIDARFADYRDLVAHPRVDAVAVCSPPDHHVEAASAAFDAGKPVFVEKPLALTVDDCDRLAARLETRPGRINVGFNLRCHRLTGEARKLLRARSLGEISCIRSVFSAATRLRGPVSAWRDAIGNGDDVLFEIAVHHFDLWRYLLDAEVASVRAERRRGAAGTTTMCVSARMDDGTLADGLFTDGSAGVNEIECFGSGGRLRVDFGRFDGLETMPAFSHSGDLRLRARRIGDMLAGLPGAVASMRGGGDHIGSYRDQWFAFVRALAGGETPLADVADGRAATRIAAAARESADRGATVRLENPRIEPSRRTA